MTDPERIQDDAMNVVLHAWIGTYLRTKPTFTTSGVEVVSEQFYTQTTRLRESAILLQAALEKMRIANERLAARMAEHKAFFAKYQTPE